MEESEKRRERLKQMRMEAAQSKVSDAVDTSPLPSYLSNPLAEGSATLPEEEDSCVTPRFDYYTDPMSAFSSNKRKSKVGNQIQQDYLTPPSYHGYAATMAQMSSCLSGPNPNLSFQPNFSPVHGINQAQGLYYSPGPYRSPVQMTSSFPSHQGTPGVWNAPNAMPRYSAPSNSPRSVNFPSPGFRPVGSPSLRPGRGRGHWFNNSPSSVSGHGCSSSPNSGRGRSGWFSNSMSPGPGRSHGRGLGSHANVSARDHPELFYKKSMLEDPWKSLKIPVGSREKVLGTTENIPGTTENIPDSPKSWLPKSVNMKRPKVSDAAYKSSSNQSLAEYLAASFNEAVNGTTDT